MQSIKDYVTHLVTAGLTGFVFLLSAVTAHAQYASDFEFLNASPGGTILTGQDGFYIPAGTDSVDFNAYTYAGNALCIPQNPDGGDQFVAAVGPASPTFGRAQRDITWGTGLVSVTYDVCGASLGEQVNADTVMVNRGILRSGDIADTAAPDDVDWCWQPDALAATVVAPINLELEGTVTTITPIELLAFLVEIRANAPGIVFRIELYDFVAGGYAPASNFANIPQQDTIFKVEVPFPDAANFVDVDGSVRARVQALRPAGVPPFWNVCLDHVEWQVQGTAANNLGSFSVQPYPGSQSYIHLFSWTNIDPNVGPRTWQAFYLMYNAAGVANVQPGQAPGPEWMDLDLDHWYRFNTLIDFVSNRVLEVSITDLDTNQTTTADVSGLEYYLEGGSAGGSPAPTGFRFFGGGGVPGNTMAWDNIEIIDQ